MSDVTTDGLSFRGYLRVLARWKWAVAVVFVAVTVAGIAYTWTRTPMYSASAEMLYVKQIDISSPTSTTYTDATAQRAEIESVPTVVQSQEVRESAEKEMSESSLAAGYTVAAVTELGADGSTYSNVVTIEATSPDPDAAADAANAYATAFIKWGRDSSRSQIADAIEVVKSQMASFTTSAQRATSEYASLKTSLNQLQLLEASATGSFKVITPASVPTEPYSPDKNKGAAIAVVAGLVLGGALAFLLEQFDTRLHGDDQISDLLGLPIIGHIPDRAGKSKGAGVLPTLTDASGRVAEAYRLLRSNLEFVGFDSEVRVLLVSSSVQAEGKSVISCNLAVSLALAGKRVVLVDGDLRSPRVHVYLDVPNAVGVSAVLARRIGIDDAISTIELEARARRNGSLVMTTKVASNSHAPVPPPLGETTTAAIPEAVTVWPDGSEDAPPLRVLTSGPLPPNPGEMVASHRFAEIIRYLRDRADVVLIDAPAMLPVGDTAAIARVVDGMVYVVNAGKVRRHDLQQARAQLGHLPCAVLGIIEVTNKRGQGQYNGYYSHADGKSGTLSRGRSR